MKKDSRDPNLRFGGRKLSLGEAEIAAATGRSSSRPATHDPVWSRVERRAAVSTPAAVGPPRAARYGVATTRRPLQSARQQAQEGLLEGPVEHGVDDRVEYAGRVAEPQEPFVEQLVEVAGGADSHGEVHRKERRPADEEQQEHGSEHLDGLALRLHRFQRAGAETNVAGVIRVEAESESCS